MPLPDQTNFFKVKITSRVSTEKKVPLSWIFVKSDGKDLDQIYLS